MGVFGLPIEGSKAFFFKKRSKKLLLPDVAIGVFADGTRLVQMPGSKSFFGPFLKKDCLLSLLEFSDVH